MTPKYDLGDIIFCGFADKNFMIVERLPRDNDAYGILPRYNMLCLDTGKYCLYFSKDIDCNSRLVA